MSEPEDGRKREEKRINRRFSGSMVAPVRIEEREDGSKKIVGLGAVYYDGTPETEYELWPGVKERIHKGAFARILKESPDVRILFNHDPNQVLGRTANGTAKVKSTKRGLEYEADPPDTQTGRDVMALLKRGDVDGSSFSFMIAKEKRIAPQDGRPEVFEILDFAALYDTGPVTFSAYAGTEAQLRGLDVTPRVREQAVEPDEDAGRLALIERLRK